MKNLTKYSILYLLIPNLLFYYYWFKPEIGIVIILVLLFYFYNILKKVQEFSSNKFNLNKFEVLILVLFAFIWTILSGVGNFTYQNIDIATNNAKFMSLYHDRWPLVFEHNKKNVIYYFGYFLTPVFFSKIIGSFSNYIIILWNTIGITFALSWIYLLFNKKIFKIVLFLSTGGIALWVNFSVWHRYFMFPQGKWPIYFNPILLESFWAPHQFIAIVVLVSLFLIIYKEGLSFNIFLLPCFLSFIWCVFPILIFAFVVLIILINDKKWHIIKNLIIQFIIKFFWLSIPILLYYASSNGSKFSFLFTQMSERKTLLIIYLAQLVPQLITIIIMSFIILKNQKLEFRKVLILSSFLILLGLCRIGVNNDLVLRGFFPILFIIFYILIYNINIRNFRFLIIFFIVDWIITWGQVFSRIRNIKFINVNHEKIYEYSDTKSIKEFFDKYNDLEQFEQYSGKSDSIYQKYLKE